MQLQKPPLGLIPQGIWDDERIEQIKQAVERYIEAGKEIPNEWIKEYNFLCKKRNNMAAGYRSVSISTNTNQGGEYE